MISLNHSFSFHSSTDRCPVSVAATQAKHLYLLSKVFLVFLFSVFSLFPNIPVCLPDRLPVCLPTISLQLLQPAMPPSSYLFHFFSLPPPDISTFIPSPSTVKTAINKMMLYLPSSSWHLGQLSNQPHTFVLLLSFALLIYLEVRMGLFFSQAKGD